LIKPGFCEAIIENPIQRYGCRLLLKKDDVNLHCGELFFVIEILLEIDIV